MRDNQAATTALLEAGSPAAKFVSKFTSRFGRFGLPTLLAALEIAEQKSAIDELAREIDGADLLEDFCSSVWSCSRCFPNYGWVAIGVTVTRTAATWTSGSWLFPSCFWTPPPEARLRFDPGRRRPRGRP